MNRLPNYTRINNPSNIALRCQAGGTLTGSNFIITFKSHNTTNNDDYIIIQHGSSQTVISFSGAGIIGECDVKITFSDSKIYINVNEGEHIASVSLKDDLSKGWTFRLGINPNGSDIYFSELIIIQTQ